MNAPVESDSVAAAGSRKPYSPVAGSSPVAKARYITSNDPRGYIPVYEYPLRGQWIMMDIDDGYILWTGIWKALGHSKADIVKFLDSEPEVAPRIRRIRGGYLKIQGTWMPYEVALRLSRRVAWEIRFELVPLFGPTFPSTCMSPDQPGFGQITTSNSRRRKTMPGPKVSTIFAVGTGRPLSRDDPSVSGLSEPQLLPTSRRTNRYTPYPDSNQRSAHFTSSIHIPAVSETRRPQPQWVRNMRQSWPPRRRSNVTLPPIMAFDNVHGMQSRDSPSVVLQRLKEDSSPHESYSKDDAYSKSAFHPPSLQSMFQNIAESDVHSTRSPVLYPLRKCRSVSESDSRSPSSPSSSSITQSPCAYDTPPSHYEQESDDRSQGPKGENSPRNAFREPTAQEQSSLHVGLGLGRPTPPWLTESHGGKYKYHEPPYLSR